MESVGGNWCPRAFAKRQPIRLGEVRVLRSPQEELEAVISVTSQLDANKHTGF